MKISVLLLGFGVAASLAALPSPAGHAATDSLAWRPCVKIAKGWKATDTRSECVLVPVPLDYAKPDGKMISIAVSRVKATGPRRGVLFTNPGGPGLTGVQITYDWLSDKVGSLNDEFDLIGIDTRGVGYSDRIDCDGALLEEPPNATEQQRFDAIGVWHEKCAAMNPELAASITMENVARDMDRIREALGVEKISFYGNSGGTAVGAMYRSMFDEHVDRMWLESIMSPVLDNSAILAWEEGKELLFEQFSAWLAARDEQYHFGGKPEKVREQLTGLRDTYGYDQVVLLATEREPFWPKNAAKLAELRDSGKPAVVGELSAKNRQVRGFEQEGNFYAFANDAFLCNGSIDEREFSQVLGNRAERARKVPFAGGGHFPLRDCAKWPFPGKAWELKPGKSQLQLSAHEFEFITPYPWAKMMQATIGGELLTVRDNTHSTIKLIECGSKLVDFFRAGKTATGTCEGQTEEPPGPTGDLAGTVKLPSCSASLVRPPAAKDTDTALLLTNGHCREPARPKPGQVFVDESMQLQGSVLSSVGRELGQVHTTKVLYATMADTDIMLAQLNLTYAELEQRYGVKAYPLSGTGPAPGQAIKVVSSYLERTWQCKAEATVPELREGDYRSTQAIRYAAECDTRPGSSGSAVLDAATGALIAVNSTSNRYGKQCELNNPCEVDAGGAVTVHQGRGYATQTAGIASCIGEGNVLDLRKPDCTLPKPFRS
ncbi:alpha/beta fold hydrolase [Amycolatopsis sp. cg5]|uniref:alpha/beta fold hydrolase n=1 Tax=Amycolatopsis sp. cg5 TaxID=3238802 RepID=UPI0035260C7F